MNTRNINTICDWSEKEWPETLHEIPQVPKKLRIRGNCPDMKMINLCIVGPRKPSRYGEVACRNIIKGLKGYPINIISGLAYGIDSIAHEAALEAGLPVIAVPGSGLNDSVIYPSEHLPLAKKILKSGGCLISEYEDDFRATRWSFPKRNRIMVGLSTITLIVEASEKSGTMITCRMTLDYNHDLLAVPGSVFSENSEGTNRLIKEGAHVIRSSEDLLHHLGFDPNI